MNDMTNSEVRPEYYDDSKFLQKFGINNVIELYQYLHKQDLNLGKLDVTTLNSQQLNSLLGLHAGLSRNGYMAYFNTQSELIVTSHYRFQKLSTEEMDTVLFFTDSFGMNVDFLFSNQG